MSISFQKNGTNNNESLSTDVIIVLNEPSTDKKNLRAYTNGAPDQFALPRVGSISSLIVLYLLQGPYILCRRTANIQTRSAQSGPDFRMCFIVVFLSRRPK